MNDYFEKVERPRGPDFFKDNNKRKQADWKKHEADVEKRSGDRRTRGSGNGHGKTSQTNQASFRRRAGVRVGDNMGNKKLRECKATVGRSITISCKFLDQLIEQSLNMGRDPVLEIRIEGATLPTPTDWVMIPADDYEEMERRLNG